MKQEVMQEDDFCEQNFDYLQNTPSVSDQEIKQKMEEIEERNKLNDEQLEEFLSQFDDAETISDSSSSSKDIDDEIDNESFLDQLESVQANTFVEEQQQQEELFENNEVQQEEQPKQLSAYELFKLRSKK